MKRRGDVGSFGRLEGRSFASLAAPVTYNVTDLQSYETAKYRRLKDPE